MGEFVFTQHLVDVSNRLWRDTSITSAVLCFSVLLVIFALSLHHRSRRYLDRVSFRIVCYSLMANTAFAIANAVGGSFTGPTPACGFTIWILQLTLQMSSLLNFCIALNMQIVIVHGIDGRNVEKYYIIGCVLLSLCITIPPYAAKQYGWDPLVQDCWYANDNEKQRLAWQIGTQLVWTGGAVVGEVISSIILITFLWRHAMRRRRIVQSVNSIVNANGATSSHAALGRGRFLRGSIDRKIDHVKAYKGIIIRIALYPLASCIINVTSITCVLHASLTHGVHSQTDYNILLLSDFFYGGRGIIYALLAASDPALVRAVKAFAEQYLPKRTWSPSSASSDRKPSVASRTDRSVAHVETSTVVDTNSDLTLDVETGAVEDLQKPLSAPGQNVRRDGRFEPQRGGWSDRERFVDMSLGTSVNQDACKSSLELEREAFEKQL